MQRLSLIPPRGTNNTCMHKPRKELNINVLGWYAPLPGFGGVYHIHKTYKKVYRKIENKNGTISLCPIRASRDSKQRMIIKLRVKGTGLYKPHDLNVIISTLVSRGVL